MGCKQSRHCFVITLCLLLYGVIPQFVPVTFSTASLISTSDSSADVTVIMGGVVSDSINPVFPRALVEKKKYHTIIKSTNLLVHEIVYWAQNLYKSQLGHSNFDPSNFDFLVVLPEIHLVKLGFCQ